MKAIELKKSKRDKKNGKINDFSFIFKLLKIVKIQVSH